MEEANILCYKSLDCFVLFNGWSGLGDTLPEGAGGPQQWGYWGPPPLAPSSPAGAPVPSRRGAGSSLDEAERKMTLKNHAQTHTNSAVIRDNTNFKVSSIGG